MKRDESQDTQKEIKSSKLKSSSAKGGGFNLSPSVLAAKGEFPDSAPISAAALAQQILKIHEDFINGKASRITLSETTTKRTASQWLDSVRELFDYNRIQELLQSKKPPMLHGKLAVLGLSLLEPELRSQLDRESIFTALIREIQPPFEEILTTRGHTLLALIADSVPNQPDDPVIFCEDDQLGRTAFAKYLARRVEAVPVDSGAYSIHIYGPWGSGKSSLLNFIREELTRNGKWVIAEFNAWRNQHIRPPWWSLMDSMFHQVKSKISWRGLLSEYWWRFNTGRSDYIFGFIILVWVLALFVFPAIYRSGEGALQSWATTAESVGKIIAVLVTLWGIVIAFSRSVLFGSAKGAKTYMELTHDPMDTIKKRFTKLVKRIKPKRMAVLIDDLDRCQGAYVIELLEGIQTLFKDASVVFIVAADRQWLNACYEENYQQFKTTVCEPGKPLGTLFLEKAFQFSSPVPGIPKEVKEVFWKKLIKVKEMEPDITREKARKMAQQQMQTANTEGSVLQLIDESRNKAFHEQRAIREEAVVRLAAPEVIERTEHALLPFAGLLDPNPRSMKRLVNTYSVNRALATLSYIDIDRNRLALWTILSLRWPVLAEYLEKNPGETNDVIRGNLSNLTDKEVKELCKNKSIAFFLERCATGQLLDEDTARLCALLRA